MNYPDIIYSKKYNKPKYLDIKTPYLVVSPAWLSIQQINGVMNCGVRHGKEKESNILGVRF